MKSPMKLRTMKHYINWLKLIQEMSYAFKVSPFIKSRIYIAEYMKQPILVLICSKCVASIQPSSMWSNLLQSVLAAFCYKIFRLRRERERLEKD